ncbi:hypothetical protein NP233_g11158 [Leucocoprinus birnbaumii]|uniref:Uncharacterized protein n=1 Tax=Leucocoprinus birnbaumii TaxID=56174 RepID=A0AAD5VHE2_9AGAR|nr:hypothetical protein NP233_g11158 [Leucocoprinus birnbaumii]
MQLKPFLFLTSLTTVVLSSSIPDIVRDLGIIATYAGELNTAISSVVLVPGFGTMLSIHSSAVSAVTMLNATAADAQTVATPVSVDDGNLVLNAVNGMKSTVESALTAVVAKKTSFGSFFAVIPGAAALNPVRQDLIALNTSTVLLGNILVSIAPPQLQAQSSATLTELTSAFATAISAYS